MYMYMYYKRVSSCQRCIHVHVHVYSTHVLSKYQFNIKILILTFKMAPMTCIDTSDRSTGSSTMNYNNN